MRGNRQEISSDGWIHDQDNAKVFRETGKKDIVLSYEKGYNKYTRVDDEKCISAKKWWMENKLKWKNVREKWTNIYNNKADLTLKKQKDGMPLFMYLFDDKVDSKKEINSVIESFLVL